MARGFEEDGVGVGELQGALTFAVIENHHGVFPVVAVVGGDAGDDIAHVGLAGDFDAEGGDEVFAFPLGDVGLPELGSAGVLIHVANGAHSRDVAREIGGASGGKKSGEEQG